jgi:hypothetical protein
MSGWLRRNLVHNLPLKLLALASAILLWYSVAHEPTVEMVFNVPVEFHNMPENIAVSAETVPTAHVRLRGPDRLLRGLEAPDIHPVIDVAELRREVAGERIYQLGADRVRVPAGVDVVEVHPSFFRLAFDRRARREVPVQARVIGELPTGYRIERITVVPDRIDIVGPEQRVNAIRTALTEVVDATGITQRVAFVTTAYVPDPQVQLTRPAPVTVIVEPVRVTASGGGVR